MKRKSKTSGKLSRSVPAKTKRKSKKSENKRKLRLSKNMQAQKPHRESPSKGDHPLVFACQAVIDSCPDIEAKASATELRELFVNDPSQAAISSLASQILLRSAYWGGTEAARHKATLAQFAFRHRS